MAATAAIPWPRLQLKPGWSFAAICSFRLCRYVDPAARGITGQRRIQDSELPEPVRELRIFGRGGRVLNGLVEAAKDLFEGIVRAFAVPARKVGKRARARLEQRGVLEDDLVGAVAVA